MCVYIYIYMEREREGGEQDRHRPVIELSY
jgi:hypothetical protein